MIVVYMHNVLTFNGIGIPKRRCSTYMVHVVRQRNGFSSRHCGTDMNGLISLFQAREQGRTQTWILCPLQEPDLESERQA